MNEKYCTRCGSANPPNAKFCFKCGNGAFSAAPHASITPAAAPTTAAPEKSKKRFLAALYVIVGVLLALVIVVSILVFGKLKDDKRKDEKKKETKAKITETETITSEEESEIIDETKEPAFDEESGSVTEAEESLHIVIETTPPETGTKQEPEDSLDFCSESLRLINEKRAQNGLYPLAGTSNLDMATQIALYELIGNGFGDTRKDGSSYVSILQERGIPYEIAAWWKIKGNLTPKSMLDLNWNGSDDGMSNPLTTINYEKIGIATGYDADGAQYIFLFMISE